MAKKTAAKSPKKASLKPLKNSVVESALALAAQMPWDMVTLTDIADKAGSNLADLSELFDDKIDILAAYGRMVDRKTLTLYANPDPSTPERDRLFDLFMERFDVLNEDRDSVVSMLKSIKTDPKQAIIGLPHLTRSMAWMLEAAGIETSGVKGALRVLGISGIYLNVLRQWMDDDTQDLSKTMAALDKNLNTAERFANSFML